MFVFWVPERARVVVISCLECAFCKSNVGFFMLVICSGYCETYVGLTEGAFKTRYNNHTSSFRNPKHKHSTELSKYIWQLKESNIEHSIHWKILKKCKAYSNRTKRCNLCLHEKYIIIYYPKRSSLNLRHELISTCRHRKKFLLCSQ